MTNDMFSVLVAERQQYMAHVGQRFVLPCHPDIQKDVDWKYRPTETGFEDYIYSNEVMYERFRDRMTVVKSDDFEYELIISRVNLNDTGLYICIEDLGYGARHVAELIVYGKFFCLLIYSSFKLSEDLAYSGVTTGN